jgi:hypothetical protein
MEHTNETSPKLFKDLCPKVETNSGYFKVEVYIFHGTENVMIPGRNKSTGGNDPLILIVKEDTTLEKVEKEINAKYIGTFKKFSIGTKAPIFLNQEYVKNKSDAALFHADFDGAEINRVLQRSSISVDNSKEKLIEEVD